MKVPARGLDTEEGTTVAALMKTRIARLALGRRTLPQSHESLQGFAQNHAVADIGLSPLTPKPHRRLLGKGSTVQKGVQVTLTVSMSPGSDAVHMASFWTRTVDADSLTSVKNVCTSVSVLSVSACACACACACVGMYTPVLSSRHTHAHRLCRKGASPPQW